MRTLYRKGYVGGPYGFIARTGGSGTPLVDELLSIAVTPSDSTWRPTASSDRQQFTATGTYSLSGAVDITGLVTWASDTVGTATIDAAGEATAVSANNGTDGAVTTTTISATLGAISGDTTLSVDTDRDATSGIRCPVNTYQWTTLLGYTPTSIRLFNETSGNIVDYGTAGKTLTASTAGAAPLYDQAVAGWDRNGLAFSGVVTQRVFNTTYGDSTANSLFVLAFVGYTGAPGASTFICTYGTTDDCSITSGSAGQQVFRYRESATIVQGVGVYSGIEPLMLIRNLAASEARVVTDSETLSPAFGATSNSNFAYGALSGTSATVVFVYAVEFFGAGGEVTVATAKAIARSLGWTIA